MRDLARLFVTIFALAGIAGCLDAGVGAGDPDETFMLTSVWIAPDGTTRVVQRPITAAEQAAQQEARERAEAGLPAPLVSRDSACEPSSLWLYDQPNRRGNQICLVGSGDVSLATFKGRFCTATTCYNWVLTSPGSFWAGKEPGHFANEGVAGP